LGEGPGGIDIAHARMEITRKDATLILANGEKYEGTVVDLDQKTLSFLPDDAKAPISLPTRGVYAVEVRGERIPGMFAGIAAGGFIGGLAGATVEDEKSGWIDLVNEHDVSIVGGAISGAVIGGFVGYWALPSRTTVTFNPPELVRRSEEIIAILVPALLEDDDRFVSFSSSGKTIRLEHSQMSMERRSNGVLIRATRSTFQQAGLDLH
jgi:hypothetical protein